MPQFGAQGPPIDRDSSGGAALTPLPSTSGLTPHFTSPLIHFNLNKGHDHDGIQRAKEEIVLNYIFKRDEIDFSSTVFTS